MEDVNTTRRISLSLSLSKFGCGLQEFNSRKFHLRLSPLFFDVLVAVAVVVVVAKAPYCKKGD